MLDIMMQYTMLMNIGLPYNDIFDTLKSFLDGISSKLVIVGGALIVVCIVVTGLMFLLGEGPGRKAKQWLIYIAVGGLVMWGAGSISSTLKSLTGL